MALAAKLARGQHSTMLQASSGFGVRHHEPGAGAQTASSHDTMPGQHWEPASSETDSKPVC